MENKRYPDHSKLFRVVYLISLFLRWVKRRLSIKRLEEVIKIRQYNSQKSAVPPVRLGAMAIVKNESQYIREWIGYHRIIGVSKFYIFDNESTDGLKEVLSDYIDDGVVVYTYLPGKGMQEKAYLQGIQMAKGNVQWMLTLDIDEFLQPLGSVTLTNWLTELPGKISQVEFGWTIFGSSGHIEKPKGLVIENYTAHAEYDFLADYKPAVRPERVLDMFFPHEYEVIGETVNEKLQKLWSYPISHGKGARPAPRQFFRVNHYYSKSQAEFAEKSARGDASVPDRRPRNVSDFKEHDRNEVADESMLKYVNLIYKNGYKGKSNENR